MSHNYLVTSHPLAIGVGTGRAMVSMRPLNQLTGMHSWPDSAQHIICAAAYEQIL